MFFDDEPLTRTGKGPQKAASLLTLVYARKPRRILSMAEVMALPQGSGVACDVELFPNYMLVGFKHIDTGAYFYLEKTPEQNFNETYLRWIMYHFLLITFNGFNYDIPMLEKALTGASLEELKEFNDRIIIENERTEWHRPTPYNHVDLIEVAPLQGSLKLYTARLHAQRIQELPLNPNMMIDALIAEDVREYNFNDLDCTELLAVELWPQIQMREAIGATIGEDIRSKSDAQIAEAVIAKEFERLVGYRPRRQKDISYDPVTYTPPSYLNFRTPKLQSTLAMIASQSFEIDMNGYVQVPDAINNLRLELGNNIYRMSIGGLHSSETCVTAKSDEATAISDFDVASYYPKIILNGGIAPPSMKLKSSGHNGGPPLDDEEPFLLIYRGIVVRRLSAKAAKRIIESDGLKITINGTFGKLGSPWSIMYSPELMLYVTMTGQLTLLLLIEAAVIQGFEVVSANTDGVVFRYAREREAELQAIVKAWEQQTSFELEKTSYKGYFARDVNNYMTLKDSGEWKTKGAYCERGSAQNSVLSRNPEAFICVDAVKAFIADGTAIEKTIRESRDVRRFVTVRNVKGGAHKDGYYLGKVVRWYYAEGIRTAIHYCLSGNQVAKTEGAKPLMELGDFPADINYQWYINEAFDILRDIGYFAPKQQRLL